MTEREIRNPKSEIRSTTVAECRRTRTFVSDFGFRISCFGLGIWCWVLMSGCGSSSPRVVLYCAQDREFAEAILDDFTRGSGVAVTPRFDTEANKSVSLYQDLVREARRPRCDVHWNNEILATIRLQRQGLLEPYRSPSAEPFPDVWKAKDGTWTAFAARARVLIVNT